MATKIFVNLPITDLKRSRTFYTGLGYTINEQFSDDTAACVVISEDIYVMILTHPKFQEFTPKPISDATKTSEVLVCLSCESRGQVDDLVRKALASGGATVFPAKDYGFMYSHGFQDPDGHIWEVIFMEPSAAHASL